VEVAVVGGGIVGLFAALELERGGAAVTVYDERGPGAGSVHAAGIIEPATAYRTNTFAFLRRVVRLWRNGTCSFRGVDARWAVESARQLERAPPPGADEALAELARSSVGAYRALADSRNDFGYAERGLVETYEDPRHFAEEREEALARRATVPVEVRPGSGAAAGSLFFPEVSWVDTEPCVDRLVREAPHAHWVRGRVDRVELDGTVGAGPERRRFDAVVVASGTGCRGLGVPLTGVRGYGWRVRARPPSDSATIYVDRGIAVVPLAGEVKVTGGWDFDLGSGMSRSDRVLEAVRRVLAIDEILDGKGGSRPCTPDGLPTVGRSGSLVVATGGFRLGWSFAPSLGRHAARLALGQESNDAFLARFCGHLRSGDLR
jgi:D-proline dehydrogenase